MAAQSGLCQSKCGMLGGATPLQARKASVVSIRRNPFAAGLNREGRVPSILNQISGCPGIGTKLSKQRPVAIAWHDDRRIWLSKKHAAVFQQFVDITGLRKNPRMTADPYDGGQDLRGYSVGSGTIDDLLKPPPVVAVILGVGTEGVDQNVDVSEDQPMLSIRSRSAAESLRSTPGITPPRARLTGSFTRASESTGLGRRIASLRPCSISAVSVVPRRSASRFACSKSPSSRRTVVLICLSIFWICLYVKLWQPCLASVGRDMTEREANVHSLVPGVNGRSLFVAIPVSSSVVINDYHVKRISTFPSEANPPLLTDADAVLPQAVVFQRL